MLSLTIKTLSLLLIFHFAVTPSIEISDVFPSSIEILDFNTVDEEKFKDNIKRCEEIWERNSKNDNFDSLTPAEKSYLDDNCDETIGDYWDIIGGGCSWYCGGGPYKVISSSAASKYQNISYGGENAHDLSYKTAWVEGSEGNGTGEFLEYYFKAQSPRITEITVVNGMIKSNTLWKNHSRAKKIKLYLNAAPITILNLTDECAAQTFKFQPIGMKRDENGIVNSKEDWCLKFEILEIYAGDQFNDLAITEIYFDGIDVH